MAANLNETELADLRDQPLFQLVVLWSLCKNHPDERLDEFSRVFFDEAAAAPVDLHVFVEGPCDYLYDGFSTADRLAIFARLNRWWSEQQEQEDSDV